jgi:hypothetical protein
LEGGEIVSITSHVHYSLFLLCTNKGKDDDLREEEEPLSERDLYIIYLSRYAYMHTVNDANADDDEKERWMRRNYNNVFIK